MTPHIRRLKDCCFEENRVCRLLACAATKGLWDTNDSSVTTPCTMMSEMAPLPAHKSGAANERGRHAVGARRAAGGQPGACAKFLPGRQAGSARWMAACWRCSVAGPSCIYLRPPHVANSTARSGSAPDPSRLKRGLKSRMDTPLQVGKQQWAAAGWVQRSTPPRRCGGGP